MADPAKKNSIMDLLNYLASFFDFLKSRTNATLFVGFIAFILAKQGIILDTNAAGGALSEAATQVGAPHDAQTLIVFLVTVLGIYFRSNPQAVYRRTPAPPAA